MTETLQELLTATTKLMDAAAKLMEQEQSKPAPELPVDQLAGKVTITPKELAAAMGLSLGKAHEIIHIQGFPVIKVGSRYVIPVMEFREWLQSSAGKAVL